MQNDADPLEESLAVSYKANGHLIHCTIQQLHSLGFAQLIWKVTSHKYLHANMWQQYSQVPKTGNN